MFVDLVLLGIALVLAAGAFVLKRHAGTLILAVLAGSLLASVATVGATLWLKGRGYELAAVRTDALVGVALTLLPALLAWFAVPKANGKRRIIGALIFGIVAAAMVAPFAATLFAENLIAQAHYDEVLLKYREAIIAGSLGYALIDLYLGKLGSGREGRGHRK